MDNNHHGLSHVVPVKLLLAVWGALMFLTAVTVGVRYIDLGELNLIIALLIATIKAALVIGFFMHLHYDNKFNAIVLFGSLIALGLFLGLTMMDSSQYQPEIKALLENKV